MKRNYKMLLTLAAAIAVGLILYVVLMPKGEVKLVSAPSSNITALIDGDEVKLSSSGNFSYKPGKYDLTLEAEGYEDLIVPISVEDGQAKTVYAVMLPSSNNAYQELSNHSNIQNIRANFKTQNEKLFKSLLPLDRDNFTADYCTGAKESSVDPICIAGSLSSGLEFFKQYGVTQQDYDLLLSQDNGLLTINKTSLYQINYYRDEVSGEEIIAVDVTPNGDSITISQKEVRRRQALDFLENAGYEIDHYSIYYSDPYLIKYNPSIHHEGHTH